MSDPALGMVQKNLAILPGWHGTAQIDRTSDPLSYAIGTLASDLRSPDGRSSIHMLAVPFHTYNMSPGMAAGMPGKPAAQRNAALLRFTSTADLLTRYILPALHPPGKLVYQDAAPEEIKARMRQSPSMQGAPDPIWDSAFAIYVNEGRETLVWAETRGSGAGPQQSTRTYLTIVIAPEGKTQAVYMAHNALRIAPPSAAWEQADNQYLAEWRRQLEADGARANAQFQRDNQAIIAQGQSNVRAMQARGAERDRAFALHEQQTSDLGANYRGYLSGTDVSFKWCGSGGVRYTTNDTRPPAPGYARCD